MRRRAFLRLSALAPLGALSLRVDAATAPPKHAEPAPDGRVHRFALGKREFLLDGRPFQIRSGEMHPIRVPAEYWTQRIRMVKAMGLNTVAIYLMWNALEQEPGVFDLESGNRDFVRFIKLCQQEGMWVYLRPGPYVCAEWDFGGLPPYLLREPDIRVRDKDDPRYMRAVARYLDTIGPHIAPLMADKGVDSSHIDVSASDETKTLTLKGHVRTAAEKTRAESIARDKADGLKVVSELQVSPK